MNRLTTTMMVAIATVAAGCTAGAPGEEASEESFSAASSAPIALSGEYRFAGEVQASARLTVDVIDMRMSDAATRLAAVRAEGATCELVLSNTYRCRKVRAASAVPAESLAVIGERNAQVYASFGEVTGPARVVSQGDYLVEWQIKQAGESSAGPFDAYRYLQMGDDMVKIVLPGASEISSLELIVKDAHHVAKWDRRVVSEGRWRWHEDMALVVLEN